MRIIMVHDSVHGNGEILARALESELESGGGEVTLGHSRSIPPEGVASNPPDLLVIGSAIRRFSLSGVTRRWIARLARALKARGAVIPHAAVFLTHVLPRSAADSYGRRLIRRLGRQAGITSVYPVWISGRVKDVTGPFVDGTLEEAQRRADDILKWMASE